MNAFGHGPRFGDRWRHLGWIFTITTLVCDLAVAMTLQKAGEPAGGSLPWEICLDRSDKLNTTSCQYRLSTFSLRWPRNEESRIAGPALTSLREQLVQLTDGQRCSRPEDVVAAIEEWSSSLPSSWFENQEGKRIQAFRIWRLKKIRSFGAFRWQETTLTDESWAPRPASSRTTRAEHYQLHYSVPNRLLTCFPGGYSAPAIYDVSMLFYPLLFDPAGSASIREQRWSPATTTESEELWVTADGSRSLAVSRDPFQLPVATSLKYEHPELEYRCGTWFDYGPVASSPGLQWLHRVASLTWTSDYIKVEIHTLDDLHFDVCRSDLIIPVATGTRLVLMGTESAQQGAPQVFAKIENWPDSIQPMIQFERDAPHLPPPSQQVADR